MRPRFHSRRGLWLPLVLVVGCGAGGLETPADPAGTLEPLDLPAADRVPETLRAIVARVNTHTITSDELKRAVRSAEIRAGQALPPQFRDHVLPGIEVDVETAREFYEPQRVQNPRLEPHSERRPS